MKEQAREEPKIVAAVERQMHTWAMNSELKDRVAQRQNEARLLHQTVDFIAISREAGAGGGEIAQCLGRRLGWKVYDKCLLDHIAERFQVSRQMLDLVDETRSNWVYDVLGTWMDQTIVPHERYASCLARFVSAAARRGPAVFVGRAAQFLLPRSRTLAVRIIASPKYRVRQIMERTGLNEKAARLAMIEIDKGRREFVQRFFHHDVTDPHNFDLVVDVDRLGREGAVEEILAAVQRHAAEQLVSV